ncbi:MAG: tetratricopeptide repeat-containing sulfotransferase family protein, partial [Woeseiaceae bacterium]
VGRTDLAIGHYRRLLARQPGMAAAHFNLALLYKKNKRYRDAIAAYEEAVRLGIRDVQEVWSNMGVVYSELHQAERAAEMYQRALDIDPRYVPALFNRAGLFEEAGERTSAVELYRRILSIDSRHWGALARLAYAMRVTPEDHSLVDSLGAAIEAAKDDRRAREELSFALAKSLDDLGRYEEAFAAYRAANELGKLRNPPYDRGATEAAFDRLIGLFTAEWIESASTGSTAVPVFICGMLRSGSTLVEQILATHPSVTAGGELDYLTWLVARKLAPYPERVRDASRKELEQLGCEYLSKLGELFPGAETITDKRPDNFLHLGLIKALFPDARIVYTRRNPQDNCLSVYFQQLGGNLFYATDLSDTAHYYRQHERLMAHWKALFPENIFTVDYDALVRSPEAELRPLLDFLGLEWDDRCLDFQQADRLVKTASVWQVREALHTRSSGRWRNYEPVMADILPGVGEPGSAL